MSSGRQRILGGDSDDSVSVGSEIESVGSHEVEETVTAVETDLTPQTDAVLPKTTESHDANTDDENNKSMHVSERSSGRRRGTRSRFVFNPTLFFLFPFLFYVFHLFYAQERW